MQIFPGNAMGWPEAKNLWVAGGGHGCVAADLLPCGLARPRQEACAFRRGAVPEPMLGLRQADGQGAIGMGRRASPGEAVGRYGPGRHRRGLTGAGRADRPLRVQRRLSSSLSSWSPRAAIGRVAGLGSTRGSTALAALASQSSRCDTRTQAAASHISLGWVVTARHGLTASAELPATGVSIAAAHIAARIMDFISVMVIPPCTRRATLLW